jgi:NAD(P)-dependent dehydrogenase (short-subunit alcohol dehydrogenase family)
MAGMRERTALVTGAARRLGRAIALSLAGRGMDVVVHFRESEAAAREVVQEIEAMGRRAWMVAADLSDAEQAGALFDKAIEKAGAVQVLVNNASVFTPSRVEDLSARDLVENLAVNTMAPMVLSRALAGRNERGVIVNLLDTRIAGHDPGHVGYELSKKLLHAFTRELALELAPGIRVNAVAPGLVLPPPGEDESFLERRRGSNPLRQHGTAEQVATAVWFLIANEFVTGQVVFVDGGRHLLAPPASGQDA